MLESHNKPISEAERKIVQSMFEEYTDNEIGEVIGASYNRVRNIRRKFGFVKEKKRNDPEGTKYCPKCKKVLPVSEYYMINSKKKLNSYCKNCSKKKYTEERIARRAAAYEEKLKQSEAAKEKVKKEYIDKHKNEKFFCKKCNEFKEAERVAIIVSNNLIPTRYCKDCKNRREQRRIINSMKINGV